MRRREFLKGLVALGATFALPKPKEVPTEPVVSIDPAWGDDMSVYTVMNQRGERVRWDKIPFYHFAQAAKMEATLRQTEEEDFFCGDIYFLPDEDGIRVDGIDVVTEEIVSDAAFEVASRDAPYHHYAVAVDESWIRTFYIEGEKSGGWPWGTELPVPYSVSWWSRAPIELCAPVAYEMAKSIGDCRLDPSIANNFLDGHWT